MVTRYNPSVHQELLSEPLSVIPPVATESLIDWLKRTGRLKPREIDSSQEDEALENLEDLEEITETSISAIEEESA